MDRDATIETRNDEAGLRQLLRDAQLLAERVALTVETGDPGLDPRIRRMDRAASTAAAFTPMDDVIGLCEGLRAAFPSVLAPGELPARVARRSTRRSGATAGTAGSPATRARRTPSSSCSTRAAER